MNDRTNLLQVDDNRLWDTMMASARTGPGRDQGLRRLALDASDKEMRVSRDGDPEPRTAGRISDRGGEPVRLARRIR